MVDLSSGVAAVLGAVTTQLILLFPELMVVRLVPKAVAAWHTGALGLWRR